MRRSISFLLVCGLLSGCGAVGRLSNVGRAPKMTPMEQPTAPAIEGSLGQQSASQRLGTEQAPAAAQAQPQVASASLFRTGAGAFLRDQRASRVGDIVTIKINIEDKAEMDNTTQRSRSGSEKSGVAALLGLQNLLPSSIDPGNLVQTNSTSDSGGSGNTSRTEKVNMTVAAVVTAVLPNGNMMIRGRQEVRVNYELRELVVMGLIRPEDIGRDNSIPHSKIAEARISYGGRGQLTDVQQARWGQQIYDALFPF